MAMRSDPHLAPRAANRRRLSPLDFPDRALSVHPDRLAVVWQGRHWTYADFGGIVARLAAFLTTQGVGPGDVVSVMLPNRPEMLAAHDAVPMLGAVLNTVNTRLDADMVGYILTHSESRLILGDLATAEAARAAALAAGVPVFILDTAHGPDLLHGVATLPDDLMGRVTDEWQAIALNYTCGTTGRPKGVVYHHRGACLNALGNVLTPGLTGQSVYLWVLPMFHCSGWCHTWAVTAAGRAHVCLDTASATLPGEAKAQLLSRRGSRHATASDVAVLIADSEPVPMDGTSPGEISLRGNTLMAGYCRDAPATEAAFAGGVYHTGDIAVRHPNGETEIRDRSKDVIISGGENISSLEVEHALHCHPAALLAARVAAPDAKRGEVPCAFVELKPGQNVKPDGLRDLERIGFKKIKI